MCNLIDRIKTSKTQRNSTTFLRCKVKHDLITHYDITIPKLVNTSMANDSENRFYQNILQMCFSITKLIGRRIITRR